MRRRSLAPLLALAGSVHAQPCEPRAEMVHGVPTHSVYGLYKTTEAGADALYIGGLSDVCQAGPIGALARWDGNQWSAIGGGVSIGWGLGALCYPMVYSFATFQNALHIGGAFLRADGISTWSVARWNGTAWGPMGAGLRLQNCADCGPRARRMLVYKGELYIAGEFTLAGGVQANHVARWNGQAWSSLNGGLGTHPELPPTHWSWNQVLDMVEFQGDVYVCGIFGKAGQITSPGIARWDGANWKTVGEPIVGGGNNPLMPIVSAMVVHDDGKGPALYAAGTFVGIGQMPASGFAKWDGASWTAVGHDNWWHGSYRPETLASFNDGTGPAIYAGGYHRLGQVPLTRWDGQTWSNLVPGLTGQEVNALYPTVENGRPVLYIGGYFAAPGQSVTSLARWIGCPCYANCDASSAAPVLTANDFQCFLNAYARGDSYANCDGSTGIPALTAADFACFLNRFADGCP